VRIVVPSIDFVFQCCKSIVPRAIDEAAVSTDISTFPPGQIALAGKFRDIITPHMDFQGLPKYAIFSVFYGVKMRDPDLFMGHVVFLPDRLTNSSVLCYTISHPDGTVGRLQGFSNLTAFVLSLDPVSVAGNDFVSEYVGFLRDRKFTDPEFLVIWNQCKLSNAARLSAPELESKFQPIKISKTNDHCYFLVIDQVISEIVEQFRAYHRRVTANGALTEKKKKSMSTCAFRFCKYACNSLHQLSKELFLDVHEDIKLVNVFDFNRWVNFMCVTKGLKHMGADNDFVDLMIDIHARISRLFFMPGLCNICPLFRSSVKFWTGRGTRGGRVASDDDSDDAIEFRFLKPTDFDGEETDELFEMQTTLREFFLKLGAEFKAYASALLLDVYKIGGLAPIETGGEILMALQVITIVLDFMREAKGCVFTMRFFPDFTIELMLHRRFNAFVNHCKALQKCLPTAVWISVPDISRADNFEHYCEFMSGAVPEHKPESQCVFEACKKLLAMAGKTANQGDVIKDGLAFLTSREFETMFKFAVSAQNDGGRRRGKKIRRVSGPESAAASVGHPDMEAVEAESAGASAAASAGCAGATDSGMMPTDELPPESGPNAVRPSQIGVARQPRGVHNGEPPPRNAGGGSGAAVSAGSVPARRAERRAGQNSRLLREIDVTGNPEPRGSRQRQPVSRYTGDGPTVERAPTHVGGLIPSIGAAIASMKASGVASFNFQPGVIVSAPNCLDRENTDADSVAMPYARASVSMLLNIDSYAHTTFAQISYVGSDGSLVVRGKDTFVDIQLLVDDSEHTPNRRVGWNSTDLAEDIIYNVNTRMVGNDRAGRGDDPAEQTLSQPLQMEDGSAAGERAAGGGGAAPDLISFVGNEFMIQRGMSDSDARRSIRRSGGDVSLAPAMPRVRLDYCSLPLDQTFRASRVTNGRLSTLYLDLLPSRFGVSGRRSNTVGVEYTEEPTGDDDDADDDADDDDYEAGERAGDGGDRPRMSLDGGSASATVLIDARVLAETIAKREGYTIIDSLLAIVYVYDSVSGVVYVFPHKLLSKSGVICVRDVLTTCQPRDRHLSKIVFMKYTGSRPDYLYSWPMIRVVSSSRGFDPEEYRVYDRAASGEFIDSGFNFSEFLSRSIAGFSESATKYYTLFQLCPGSGVQEQGDVPDGNAFADPTCHRTCSYKMSDEVVMNISTLHDIEFRNSGEFPFLCTSSLAEIAMPLCRHLMQRRSGFTVSDRDRRYHLLDKDDPYELLTRRQGRYAYAYEFMGERMKVFTVPLAPNAAVRSRGESDSEDGD
jgi:hypothetical protein